MATITSAGVGSGLDINTLVNSLVAAAGQPVSQRLDRQEFKLQAQLSALGSFKSALSSFNGSLAALNKLSAFQKRTASSSNTELFTVTASGKPVSGSYDVEVMALAQAQKLTSRSFDEAASAVGTGTLTFQFGDPTKPAQSITIDEENNSLTGIRDAVNAAAIGVRASIIKGDEGYHLVFSAEQTGTDNSLRISVTDDDGDGTDLNGLSRLAYDPDAAAGEGRNLTEAAAAQDAVVKIDGITVTSATNTISDAISGLTLTLKKAEPGASASLNVSLDKASVTSAVEGFVNAYNDLMGVVKQLSGYNPETKEAGVLISDASVRGITNQIRSVLGAAVPGLDGPYRSLAEIGVTTQADGKLGLDKAKLTAAMESNFDDIGRIFAATATATDPLVSYSSSTDDTQVGLYAVNITQAATRGSYEDAASSVSNLVVDETNDNFTIKVDGVSSGIISLTRKTYGSEAELAAELQSRINGDSALKDAGVSVLVSYDEVNNRFVFTSERYGSESSVQITTVKDATASGAIGLTTTGVNTEGLDVAGTIGGMAAIGSGQYLTGVGAAEGLKILIEGEAIGERGAVSFTRGVADRLGDILGQWLAVDGSLNSRTKSLKSQIDGIGDQRDNLARRLEALEKRYRAQFTALDVLVGQMQTTNSFLMNQLGALPGAYSGG